MNTLKTIIAVFAVLITSGCNNNRDSEEKTTLQHMEEAQEANTVQDDFQFIDKPLTEQMLTGVWHQHGCNDRQCFCFSDDNMMVIYTGDIKIPCTWDIKTDTIPAQLELTDCWFDNSMKAIVVMGTDNTIKLELSSGTEYPAGFSTEALVYVR